MTDLAFNFDIAEPAGAGHADESALQNINEIASDDDQDVDMEDTSPLDSSDEDDDDFKLDGSYNLNMSIDDEDDSDDGDDYKEPMAVSKTRKSTRDEHDQSKQTTLFQVDSNRALILEEVSSSLARHQSSRTPGNFGRRGSQKTGNKRVSAKLDPDDELMLEMREKGYSDRQIADKLAKDGRVRYDQKSISTRIMRIRLAQAEHFDFLLQEGYKEWELEDDQLLVQAYALADIEISYEIERVRAWRFRKVSEYLRRLNKDSLFSASACRIRYGQLTSGTARIPCDVDDDPETRREELQDFRLSREAAREKEGVEAATRQVMEKRVKESIKARTAQKAEEIANKRAAKEVEKANRAVQRAAQAQLRMQKATENQKAKMERNARVKKNASIPKKRERKAKPDAAAGLSEATSSKTTSKKAVPARTVKTDPEAVDPRSYLIVKDLTELCAARGLPTESKTKEVLVTSLVDADKDWSYDQLRKMCKAKGVSAGATKAVMSYQLALKAAQSCSSFAAGLEAAEEADAQG